MLVVNQPYLFKRLVNFGTVLKLSQDRFAIQVCAATLEGSSDDQSLGAIPGPEDGPTVRLPEAPLLHDRQDDRRLFVVQPDKVVMDFSQKVFRIPKRLVFGVFQDWSGS